jgi:rSAM/selenodomain-associated transferase 2
MNAGAAASRGEILLFLHADTQLPPNVDRIIESTLADPEIVGGRFDVRFDHPSAWGTVISTLMNWRSRWSGIATGDQTIFVRRQAFDRLGGFSDIPLMEDVDFSTRLKQIGPIAALRETVITSFRRWEQNGPLKTILLMWTLRFLYWIGVNPRHLDKFYAAIR